MKRYIALLRGINISGRNKISMPELKKHFIECGFDDVVTYLNSGNVIFDSDEDDERKLEKRIGSMIKKEFDLDIPVFVLPQQKLAQLLEKAPEWWGTDDEAIYDNLIFLMAGFDVRETAEMIGDPTEGLEKIFIIDNSVFWSFDRKKYAKANWWKKTASAGIADRLTIRTANTLRKIVTM